MSDKQIEEKEFATKELEASEPKCIGCNTKEEVTKCDGTMCKDCWSQETVDEDTADWNNYNE